MNIYFFELLFLLGCLQGVITAGLLWCSRKGNRLSNRLLSVLMVLMASACLAVGIPVANQGISLMLDLLPLVMVMPIGPILYFYSRSLLEPGFQLGRREKLHFLPVLLDCGAKIIGWIYVGGLLLGVFRPEDGSAWGHVMDQYNTYIDIPHWISISIYLWLSHRLLVQHAAAGNRDGEVTCRWLVTLHRAMLGFQVMYLLFLIPYILPAFHNALLDVAGYAPIYVPLVVIIYWIGIKGYLYAQRTVEPTLTKKNSTAPPTAVAEEVTQALRKAMEEDHLYRRTHRAGPPVPDERRHVLVPVLHPYRPAREVCRRSVGCPGKPRSDGSAGTGVRRYPATADEEPGQPGIAESSEAHGEKDAATLATGNPARRAGRFLTESFGELKKKNVSNLIIEGWS